MFATDSWMDVAVSVTRHIVKVLRPAVMCSPRKRSGFSFYHIIIMSTPVK